MKFTVSFTGQEDVDTSYGLVFIPGPCWVEAGAGPSEIVVNMAERPDYVRGGVDKLLKARPQVWAAVEASKDVVVIAHPQGHGRPEDLAELVWDLEGHGLRVHTLQIPGEPR